MGKDAGELAGLDVTTGVAATNDLDAIIAAKPDCVVYCAMGDTRLPEAMADVRASSPRASTSSVRRPACCSTRGR